MEQIIIAVIGALSAIFVALIANGYIQNKKNPTAIDRRKRTKLIFHPVFSRLNELEAHLNTRFALPDKGRTALAKEVLLKQISIWRPLLQNVAEKTEVCSLECEEKEDCNKLRNTNLDVFTQGIVETACWHQRGLLYGHDGVQFNAESVETLTVFINKFLNWNSARESTLRMRIADICVSKMISGCYQRQWHLFDGYLYFLVETMLDAEKTLAALNGELDGRIFAGHEIKH